MRAAGGCQPPNPAFSALFRAVFRAWRVGKRKVRDGFFPKNRAGRSAPKRAFVAGIKELDRAMRFFAATQAEMNTLRRYNVWLMAAGFVLLFGAGIAALLLAGRARETAADVTHTIEVRSELLTILNLLQGAEAGQRGYLLTRDEQYLEPYTAAHRQIDEELAVLENLPAIRSSEPAWNNCAGAQSVCSPISTRPSNSAVRAGSMPQPRLSTAAGARR